MSLREGEAKDGQWVQWSDNDGEEMDDTQVEVKDERGNTFFQCVWS